MEALEWAEAQEMPMKKLQAFCRANGYEISYINGLGKKVNFTRAELISDLRSVSLVYRPVPGDGYWDESWE